LGNFYNFVLGEYQTMDPLRRANFTVIGVKRWLIQFPKLPKFGMFFSCVLLFLTGNLGLHRKI